MEFLESIILPQSAQRIELLSYLTTISYMILLPYLALLFGSTLLSCMFNARGKSYQNAHYIKLSKDLISLPTFNIYVSFGLIVLPILILMFYISKLEMKKDQFMMWEMVCKQLLLQLFLYLNIKTKIYFYLLKNLN